MLRVADLIVAVIVTATAWVARFVVIVLIVLIVRAPRVVVRVARIAVLSPITYALVAFFVIFIMAIVMSIIMTIVITIVMSIAAVIAIPIAATGDRQHIAADDAGSCHRHGCFRQRPTNQT